MVQKMRDLGREEPSGEAVAGEAVVRIDTAANEDRTIGAGIGCLVFLFAGHDRSMDAGCDVGDLHLGSASVSEKQRGGSKPPREDNV